MAKKKESEEIKEFFRKGIRDKRVLWGITLVLFLIILISSTSIRLSNVEVLKDSVTGEYLSNDLDSMLFYRQAETRMNLGYWPDHDEMRSPGYETQWIKELINDALIWNYKILNFFDSDITFNYAATISAPIFYAVGLILFFILCLLITKSKLGSLAASALLAYAPGFLFRSISGFYDHDHLGVFALFVVMIAGFFGFKFFEKSYKSSIIWGVVIGFFTALMLYSWGGGITFLLVLLPVAFFLHYLFNVENKERFFVFYLIWVVAAVIFTPLLGMNANQMYGRFLDSQGILVLFVLGFSFVDSLIYRYKDKMNFLNKKYLHGYSFGLTFVLGIVGLFLIGKNPITLFRKAWATLIYPFFGEFGGRLSATVAENKQPYLVELISQNGDIVFWLFLVGLVFITLNFVKNSKSLKNKTILGGFIIFLFFGVLFSRISSGGLLNGENLISQALYLFGGLGFVGGLGYVYSKEKFKISVDEIFLFAIALTVAINARAAVRSFFLITPFICLIAGYGISELWKKARETKEESFKPISWILIGVALILVFVALFGNPIKSGDGTYYLVSTQAKYVGPSANVQWQNAMAWARNETPEDSIFVHWWDYGYFVQTLGERATVTDGGHSGGDHADHYIGRYILTTPNPKTALSYMKTWNVSYLLIDPTEMGKYGAFSKIGSNDSWDRISSGIFGGASDESQMQETANGIAKVYQLGGCVDQDLSYSANGTKIFLPGISITKTQ
jgi:asparagine N-glycosylation enzyme membrane subunit Stt3